MSKEDDGEYREIELDFTNMDFQQVLDYADSDTLADPLPVSHIRVRNPSAAGEDFEIFIWVLYSFYPEATIEVFGDPGVEVGIATEDVITWAR